MDRTCVCANCSSTDHRISAFPTYKKGMKPIGLSLEDEDASEFDYIDFMRAVIRNSAQGVSFVTWRVILNRTVHNFGMLWPTSSIQGMRKLYRV